MCSPFVPSHDSQGYSGGIRTRLQNSHASVSILLIYPLHGPTENTASHRFYVVACTSVAKLTWHLLCRNLVMDVSSEQTITAFRRRATTDCIMFLLNMLEIIRGHMQTEFCYICGYVNWSSHATYIDLSSFHFGYLSGFKLQLSIRLHWTDLIYIDIFYAIVLRRKTF
jgi:hypothetical protein